MRAQFELNECEETVRNIRRHTRRAVRTPLEFTPWNPRCIIFGFATDISVAGAFVQTHFPAAAGSDVVLRLWPSGWDEELVLAGVVRWAKSDGMGVEFASVGPRETQAIDQIVARHRPSSTSATTQR
jgi:hypothetical protein